MDSGPELQPAVVRLQRHLAAGRAGGPQQQPRHLRRPGGTGGQTAGESAARGPPVRGSRQAAAASRRALRGRRAPHSQVTANNINGLS